MLTKIIFALSFLVVVSQAAEVRRIEADGSHLVDTSPNNYAIRAPTLEAIGWKTVSVNGNSVVILSSTCQSMTKPINSLTEQNINQLKLAKNQLEAIETNYQLRNGFARSSVSRQTLPGTVATQNSMSNAQTNNINLSNVQINGFSTTRQDDNNFSISKPNMPNNLASVYYMNDVVTYVYLNGQVQMKPVACLDQAEQQYIQQLKSELAAAQQQLQMNMQNMQANLQQNMQNMQQSMSNMFGNGFPFNQGNRFMQQQPQLGGQNQAMTNTYAGGYGNPGMSMGQTGLNYGAMQAPAFGNNWPFGPRNNPFGPGFPFNG